MIIVDLDKLHFPFTTARPEYAQGVQDLHKAILKCKVDAIPVEWMVEWLADGNYGIAEMLHSWFNDDEIESELWDKVREKAELRHKSTYVEHWGKENETKTN